MIEYTGFRIDGTRAVMSISGETGFLDLVSMFKQHNMILIVSECGYVYRWNFKEEYWAVEALGM